MMNNLSERDRRTLTFGAGGVGLILFVVLVLFPVMDYWTRLDNEYTKKVGQINQIRDYATDSAAAAVAMKSLSARASLHPTKEALNQQTPGMLIRMQQIPGYADLNVRRLQAQPLRPEKKYYKSGVVLQFTSSATKLHQFLAGVENATPSLKVERLTLSLDPDNASRVQGTIEISGYAVVAGKGTSG